MRRLALVLGLWVWGSAEVASAFVWPNTAEQIARDLRHADAATRRRAAERLTELPESVARRSVLQALEDPDAEVRLLGAHAAVSLGVEAASDRVIAWLSDSDRRIRIAAASVLRALPRATAVAPLARLLADPDEGVRVAAAEALGASRSPDATLPLLGHLDDSAPAVRRAVVLGLSSLGDQRAVVPLIGKIQDSRPDVRSSVARALGELRDPRAVAALVLALRDDEPSVRVAALEALGRLGDSSATLPIATLLREDARPAVQQAALAALSRLGSPTAIEALMAALARGEPAQVEAAQQGLVRLGQPAVPALLACLGSQPAAQLAAACLAVLGRLGADQAIPPIIAGVRRGSLPRDAALRALAALGEPSTLPTLLEHLNDQDPAVRAEAVAGSAALLDPERPDGRAVEPISRALRQTRSRSERVSLARLLGRTGSERAAPELLPLAQQSDDIELRVAALEALGLLGPSGQDAALLSALDAEHAAVRWAAAVALRRSAAGRSAPVLLERLARRAEQDRVALAHALAGALARSTSASAAARTLGLIRGARGGERDALIEALGHAPGPLGSRPLLELQRDTPHAADRAKIAEALVAHPEAVSSLRELLGDVDGRVRANAAWALAEVGTANDAAALVRLRSDGDPAVAGDAVGALARLAQRLRWDAAGPLCGAVGDPRAAVRVNALRGLRLLGRRCAGHPAPSLLERDSAELVRQAAAVLIQAVPASAAQAQQAEVVALDRCAARDPSGAVAEACRQRAPALPQGTTPVVVLVVPVGEQLPVPEQPFTLARADGLLRFGWTDRRGAVFERFAPRGQISLETPAAFLR